MPDSFLNRALNKILPGAAGSGNTRADSVFGMTLSGRSPAGRPGPISVGIFGKHRRSPEHLFDLGGSAELAGLKDTFYDHGIRAAVDQNVWKDLAGDSFISFNHVLVAKRGNATLVARVAATRDDLRRTDFPMIVAAAQPNAGLSAVPTIFEVVRATFHDAARAHSLAHLHEVIAFHRDQALTSPPKVEPFPDDVSALSQLAGCPELGPDDAGLLKILYQMDRQMTSWIAAANASRSGLREPAHIRVPAIAAWPVESAALWAQFFAEQTAAQRAPIMAFAHAAGQMVDVFVGDPTPSQLRCLHAAITAMPDATAIPYELDADFMESATSKLAAAAQSAAKRDHRAAPAARAQMSVFDEMDDTPRRPVEIRPDYIPPIPQPVAASSEIAVAVSTLMQDAPLTTHVEIHLPTAGPDLLESLEPPPAAQSIAASAHRTATAGRLNRKSGVLTSRWPIILVSACVGILTIFVLVLLLMTRHSSAP